MSSHIPQQRTPVILNQHVFPQYHIPLSANPKLNYNLNSIISPADYLYQNSMYLDQKTVLYTIVI